MNKIANYHDIAGYICEMSKYDRSNCAFSENSVTLAKAFIKQIGDINNFADIDVANVNLLHYNGFDTDGKVEAFFKENKAACLELMNEAMQEENSSCSAYISSIAPDIVDEAEIFKGFMFLVDETGIETKDDNILSLRKKFINGFVRDIYARIHQSFKLHYQSWLF